MFAYWGNKYWLLFAALEYGVLCATHTLFLPSGLGSLRFTSLEFVNNLFSQVQSPRRSVGSNMRLFTHWCVFLSFFAHYTACLLSHHYLLWPVFCVMLSFCFSFCMECRVIFQYYSFSILLFVIPLLHPVGLQSVRLFCTLTNFGKKHFFCF